MTSALLGFVSFAGAVTSGVLWFRAIGRVAIPENRTGFVAVWAATALIGIGALLGEPGWLGGTAATLGALGSAFFLFTVSISRQRVGAGAIEVGATIPAFSGTAENGQPFESQELAGHPVLIKFFRGHW